MNVLRMVDKQVGRHPMAVSAGITGFKAWLADWMVQRLASSKDYDVRRGAVFALFGCTYQGIFQYVAMNRVLEVVWPGTRLRNVAVKVLCTNAILDPVFFFPSFYTMKEGLTQQKIDTGVLGSALGQYQENYMTDWRNSWMVWLPAHTVTYGFVPVRWRMPWVATVSFGYVCLLSFTRGEITRRKNTNSNSPPTNSHKKKASAANLEEDDAKAPAAALRRHGH